MLEFKDRRDGPSAYIPLKYVTRYSLSDRPSKTNWMSTSPFRTVKYTSVELLKMPEGKVDWAACPNISFGSRVQSGPQRSCESPSCRLPGRRFLTEAASRHPNLAEIVTMGCPSESNEY